MDTREALFRLVVEFPAIRVLGYCHAVRPRPAGATITHVCLRACGHSGLHLCGCGVEWEVPGEPLRK